MMKRSALAMTAYRTAARRARSLVRLARLAAAGTGLLLLPASALFAQTRGTVTGRVTASGSGEPLQGATVLVTGTTLGATARTDGSYTITLAPGRHQLTVRYIGYRVVRDTVEVTAGGSVTKNFTLDKAVATLDQMVVLGTRRANRTVLEAPVPIDVITAVEIKATGRTEIAQILQMIAPSFNFPRATVADGTDHVRPSTLRGLNPDQVLVLVNGKRRHTSALINVNGTVGRGSSGVDLNAIPVSAIDRIEVLRDGAAAQYGSDAISGVINIILKSNVETEVTTTVGQTKEADGDVLQVGASHKLAIGTDGFLTVSGEYRDRSPTNRSRPDTRQQYFTGDARNNDPNLTKQINHRQGDSDTRDYGGFANFAKPLRSGVQVYAFGGLTKREGNAAGFWRRALDDRTVRSIHPNGFLPLINSDILDYSATGGAKGSVMGWLWDLSALYGKNTFAYDITNTNNASLGAASPTKFYAGKMGFGQLTSNLDLVRTFDVGFHAPLNVATGVEFRRDDYQIERGEEGSYVDGRARVLDGPNAGNATAPGSQVFPGFRPSDETDASRSNFAGYIDLEANLSERWLVGLAARAEKYSDFGSTTDGKLTARVQVVPGLALRGAASTGFRAPSLAQSFFSSTATNFINGVPFENRTFPVSSDVARALGAQPLKPEQSINYSAGLAFDAIRNFQLTADFYRIQIDDRVVFSGNLINATTRALLVSKGFNVAGARYFTNAIDTDTRGLDVVASFGFTFNNDNALRFNAAFNKNRTKVVRLLPTPPELSTLGEALFDRIERARVEKGQPQDNFQLTGNYTIGDFGLNVHLGRFGRVTTFGTTAANDQTFSAKSITDVNVSYRVFDQLTITAGADNVFDVYPERNIPANSNSGIFPYNGISPFGFNGAFYFLRLTYGR